MEEFMMKIAVVASNGKASRAIIEELVARGVVDVMALPSVASDARIALYAPCGGLRAHRPRAACAADSDSLVFASDRFSCPMRVPMLYYFLYHDVHKNNNNKL